MTKGTSLLAEPVLVQAAPGARVFFPMFTATLTERTTGLPVPGRTVEFTVGGPSGCYAVTDDQGVASCGNVLLAADAILFTSGYFAIFRGDGLYGVASAWLTDRCCALAAATSPAARKVLK